jgi:formate hydrogenlyase subunit 6/NADH:ubiquinone oxidoreductase subunit I
MQKNFYLRKWTSIISGKESIQKTKVFDWLNTLNCSLCKLCIEVCEAGAVKIIPILDSFVMTAESSGEMPAKELVASASQEIRKRAVEFEAKLAELS